MTKNFNWIFLGEATFSEEFFSFSESNNAAFKKPTAQSGTIKASSFATDGSHYNINTEKCTKTTSQKDPWWRVDLEREVLVHDVYIYKHSYVSVNYLLQIRVGNHDNPNLKKNSPCGGSFRFKQLHWKRIRCPSPLKGRFVSITRIVGNGILKLCEVEVREEGKFHQHSYQICSFQNVWPNCTETKPQTFKFDERVNSLLRQ